MCIRDSIDTTKAQADLDRAQAKIDNTGEGFDLPEVLKDLKRAKARPKAVQLAGARG